LYIDPNSVTESKSNTKKSPYKAAMKGTVQADLYLDFSAVVDNVPVEGGTRCEDISDDFTHYNEYKDDDDQSEGAAKKDEGEIVVISESCFEC
jgi:hypothetical protein